MSNLWDALKETAKGFTEGYKEKRLAETKMRSELETGMLMAKMKSMWDLEAKKEEKKLTTPYEDMMMEEWKAQQEGMKGVNGVRGAREITPGATGFTTKKLGLKEMAERVYQKDPSTWTNSDKQVVNQYKAYTKAGRVKTLPTVRESGFAKQSLFKEYLGHLYSQSPETSGIEKLPFIQSRRELIGSISKGIIPKGYATDKGKLDVQKLLSKLGVTPQDFQKFASDNFPDEAKTAFPEIDQQNESVNY